MEASLALTAILPGAAPGAGAPAGGSPSSPEGGEVSLFAVLAALAAGEPAPPAMGEGPEAGASVIPPQAVMPVPAAPSARPVANDLALVLAQAAAMGRPAAAGGPDGGKAPGEAAGSKTDRRDSDAEIPPDEAAPAPDPSLVLATANPAPPVPAAASVAAGAGEPGSGPGPAAAGGSAPVIAPAVTEAASAQDGATRAGPAWEEVSDGRGNAALAKSAPGAASLPVRQDEGARAPHELPAAASKVAVARAGAHGRDIGSGEIPGVRNGTESAGGRPAAPMQDAGAPPAGPSAGPPAAAGASDGKAPARAHGAPTAEGAAREDKPAASFAAHEAGPAEATRLDPVDPAPAPVPSHPGSHPARAVEAGPAPPLPNQPGAAVPVVPNVPLAAVPVEIGMRSLAGLSRFEIRLEPEDLGRIDVRLDIDGENVQARLVVDRVETLALLQRDAKTLERAFEQAGLKPSEGGLDLSLRDPQGDARGQHRGDDRPARESPERRAPPDPDADAPPRILRTLWRPERRLDLRI